MKIGGPAGIFYALSRLEELPGIIECAAKLKIPYVIIGGGTNLIFSEKGFRGLIIRMQANKVQIEDNMIIAEAGAPLGNIIILSLKHNLYGLQKLMGVPGTIGGALRGNAGANGAEIKDFIHKAEILTPPENHAQSEAKCAYNKPFCIAKHPLCRRPIINY